MARVSRLSTSVGPCPLGPTGPCHVVLSIPFRVFQVGAFLELQLGPRVRLDAWSRIGRAHAWADLSVCQTLISSLPSVAQPYYRRGYARVFWSHYTQRELPEKELKQLNHGGSIR